MNYTLNHLPERSQKPRQTGLTMVMDKGLSINEVENFLSVCEPHADIAKLGWATSFVTPNLDKKLAVYRQSTVKTYFGGTLFEAFIVRKQFDDYRRILHQFKMEYVEVSDGTLTIPHDEKCEYIRQLATEFIVLSEVGSKDSEMVMAPYKWVNMMRTELQAGAYKVIAEARESGTAGIYRPTHEAREGLIDEIINQIEPDKIMWEAPLKEQQTRFIKLLGSDVNLGNIPPNEVIPLETLRLGLRSDTFNHFLKLDGLL